jgi:hypothetical protein
VCSANAFSICELMFYVCSQIDGCGMQYRLLRVQLVSLTTSSHTGE